MHEMINELQCGPQKKLKNKKHSEHANLHHA